MRDEFLSIHNADFGRWLLNRTYVMDGHFSAEHLKMRNPWDDVILTDGSGFMVQNEPYQQHLKIAREVKDVSLRYRAAAAAIRGSAATN